MPEKSTSRRRILAWTAGGLALVTVPGGINRALRPFLKMLKPVVPEKPGGIVVHHSATEPDRQAFVNARVIDEEHKRRGLGVCYRGKTYHIAYHYLILPDGTVEPGRPEKCRGGHTRSLKYNHWIGICLVGCFDPMWKDPYHRPTEAQMQSLAAVSARVMEKYGFDHRRIVPHRLVNPTECPGRSFPMEEYVEKAKAAGGK